MSEKPRLSELREQVRAATHGDEEAAVDHLLAHPVMSEAERLSVHETAARIVNRSRAMKEERGTLDAFLQEFGLSNQEGVALMCLAEALLRIPDADTQDALIAEKVLAGDWDAHKGKSEDMFVNAGVWALMLTGGVIELEREQTLNPLSWIKGLVGRIGEPVIREAVMQAMRIMGRQFVYGRDIGEALKRSRKDHDDGGLFSFDMLGEGARTEAAAKRYEELYLEAIDAVGKAGAERGGSHRERSSISIKLSALHPRYEAVKKARVMGEMLPRLKRLALAAKAFDMGLTIDAEEADRLDISLELFEALAFDDELKGWQGLGLAVQAYQKRAPLVIDWLVELARQSGRRLPVRLVKGAYWDTEIKHAQELGHADYPVWTRKATTDICYLATAKKMLAASGEIFAQFASHNAHTLAAIAEMARDKDFEFQRIHGMGDLLIVAAASELEHDVRFRTYAPVGLHEDLLPYLVRRLLENGANSSFVNRFMDADIAVDEIVRDPFETVGGFKSRRHTRIPVPRELYGEARKNSAGIDLAHSSEQARVVKNYADFAEQSYEAPSLIGGEASGGDAVDVTSPIDGSKVGTYRAVDRAGIERAIGVADAAQPAWDARGGEARAEILERAGDLIEASIDEYMNILAREAGKTAADAISEVREAADFCRYYAMGAREHFAAPQLLQGPTGESNELGLHGRGVFACISPWNFPLAIFTGQVVAALAAGNSVVCKPAAQTPLVAAYTIRLLHKAGVPGDVVNLIIGSGRVIGEMVTGDPRISGVAFTGSTWTARTINRSLAGRDGPIAPLIAETGGQNVMIVDSSALPEQVSDDVMISAFSSAGQRCSALRVLFIHNSIADKVIEMLKGALAERQVGDPRKLATDVGPAIGMVQRQELQDHADKMNAEAKIIATAPMPEGLEAGSYFAPHIFEIPSLDVLEDEVFGPILHIVRYDENEIEDVIQSIRLTGYGLTFGVHSRIEERWLDLFAKCRVGNAYVNRNMIGAVVGVQPFGGQGLSGTGPKAGGPHYLYRFATEKVLTVNTAAIGGNTELFRLEEGGE